MKDTEARIETLYDAIKHGDDEHKAWLKQAIDAHFSGQPVPAPRGQGNKEAQIEALTAERDRLREALDNMERRFEGIRNLSACGHSNNSAGAFKHSATTLRGRLRQIHASATEARAALSTPAEPVKPRVKKLPDVMPGHWETAEGHEKALEYFSKNRGDLAMGDVPDLALANAVYLIDRSDTRLVEFQGAAKERIRWLSAQLAARLSSNIEDA